MKIKKKNELPDWFDVDKYEVLKSLNDHDMLSQLIVRRDWLKGEWGGLISVNTYNDITGLYDDAFSKIIQPLDSRTFYKLRMGRKKYSNMEMAANESVEPTKIIDMTRLKNTINDYIDKNNIKNSLRGQKASVSMIVNHIYDYHNKILINLNLDYPDEILLDDIKKLLPIWREELKIDSSLSQSIKSWDVVKRKIFEYKVFPIIDLMCWEMISGVKITNKKIAQSVFKYGEYDSINITQTIKPFIENLMDDFSIEKYQRIIT
ncbi:DUF6387 family protein [Xenorhabdus littoralis]|uniref:DUF6387 family protein n=1 Tax=Xenorhabdus littoralis TaxID=2582835 RepID=UPI0029E7D688|nr:DUF6387 family protein [Xenorhabdus sp. psl]